MRKIIQTIGLLVMLGRQAVQAQQPAGLKAEVYSAFLRQLLAEANANTQRKSTSVVVIPLTKYISSSFTQPMARMMRPSRLTRADTVQAPDPSLDGKSAPQWQPLPVGTRIRRPGSEFDDWLRADTSLVRLGQRFDALEQKADTVAGPIKVPGYVVRREGPDFFESTKWRDWWHFYRKNRYSYGVVELSDMAFSIDFRYAVFYVGIHQGNLNGVGCYVFMEKTASGWQTKFTRMLWIS